MAVGFPGGDGSRPSDRLAAGGGGSTWPARGTVDSLGMGDDLVTFRLDGEVTIGKLSVAFARFSTVLDALGEDRGANVRWVLVGLDFASAAAGTAHAPHRTAALRHRR